VVGLARSDQAAATVPSAAWIGPFFAADAPASSALTRELLGRKPTHQGLLADLEAGHYTREYVS
jgi:hypothetical protein